MIVQTALQKAYQWHKAGNYTKAKLAYISFLDENDKHDECWHLLGLLYLQTNAINKAISAFKNAIYLSPTTASYHYNLSLAYKKNQQLDESMTHCEKVIHLNPQHAQAHNTLANLYQKENNFHQALQHYIKATHLEPTYILAHENLALLLIRVGKTFEAKKQCETIIILDKNSFLAHYHLANLLLLEEALDKAKDHYTAALLIHNHTDCLNNLGVIALKEEKPQLAIDYFSQSLALDNDNLDARNNLAATFIQYDRYENAMTHYFHLLKAKPNDIEFNFNMGVAQMNLGHLNKAICYFETVIKLNTQHADSYVNLAAIASRLNDKEKAKSYLKKACLIAPHDESSHFMLQALEKKHVCYVPTSYIKDLFDNYAVQYDKHLLKTLQYKVPTEIETYLKTQALNTPVRIALDLGCGTGLCGEVLHPYTEQLVGVDISSKMLNIAKEKAVYHTLIEMDILAYLHTCGQSFSLVCAADVLPYIGDLTPLFSALLPVIEKEGLFIFSIEKSSHGEFHLQESARFCHSSRYIKSLCKKMGISIRLEKEIVARTQDNKAVNALLYVLEKNQ